MEGVKLADFRFWHVFTNKVSLKVGLNLIFYRKNLLWTLKLIHLLWKNKTFISNPSLILRGPKKPQKQFFSLFFTITHQNMGLGLIFRAKFCYASMILTYKLYKRRLSLVNHIISASNPEEPAFGQMV